jgi:uncharacterized protein (DUF885 family)
MPQIPNARPVGAARAAAALVLALLAGPPPAAAQAAPADRQEPDRGPAARALHALFAASFEDNTRRFPEWATYRGDHRFGDRLTDASPEAQTEADEADEADEAVRRRLAEAQAIDPVTLLLQDRISRELFIEEQQRPRERAAVAGWHTMTLGALGGPHTQFADLLAVSPVSRAELVEKTLARMAAYPRRIDQEIANLQRGLAAGWVPPREVLQRVLAQIDGQITVEVEANPHYAPFRRLSPQIPAADRERLQAAAREAIVRHVVPAQQRLRAEMDAVRVETKFPGDWAAFVQFMNTDPRFFHDSPQALLAGYREIATRLDAELPLLFAELPRAPYGVSPMPAHMGARAEYYNGPALAGSRGGTFFADVLSFRKKPKWAMETLVAHEAVPGHHLQIARATGAGRAAGLPPQRLRLHRLQRGLGWTRQQAVDFMVDQTGVERGCVESEVDRYTSMPGQALAYVIGKLRIEELRDRARARLGSRFDIRRFHNAVLDQGALSLPVLGRQIDACIDAQPKA